MGHDTMDGIVSVDHALLGWSGLPAWFHITIEVRS